MKLAVFLFAMTAPLWAHHSFAAEFDINRPVRLEGVVTRFDWVNPHIEIHLDVEGVRWTIEAGSPNALLRRGFNKTSICQGTRVIIEGYQAKSGAHRASGRDIVLPGGQKLLLDAIQ